jgi:cell wall-associated NlpC family hydrolase
MDQFLANKGMLARIDHVRQTVGEKASELVFTAMGFLGVPYRRGGNTAESGFDCSGFVRATYQKTIGLILPRKAEQQAAATQKIEQTDLQPGDLVFFNTMRRAFSHVGIYVGEGKFIHSPKPGAQVRVEDMGGSYWRRRFDGARRVQTAQPEIPADQILRAVEPAIN